MCSITVDDENGIGMMDVAGGGAPLCALMWLGSDADKKDEAEIKIQSCRDSIDTLCSVNKSSQFGSFHNRIKILL